MFWFCVVVALVPFAQGQDEVCSASDPDKCSFTRSLKKAGLQQYQATFLAEGYDSMAAISLMDLTEVDTFATKSARMAEGHKKLMKKLWKQAQKEEGDKVTMTYVMPKKETFEQERLNRYQLIQEAIKKGNIAAKMKSASMEMYIVDETKWSLWVTRRTAEAPELAAFLGKASLAEFAGKASVGIVPRRSAAGYLLSVIAMDEQMGKRRVKEATLALDLEVTTWFSGSITAALTDPIAVEAAIGSAMGPWLKSQKIIMLE